MVGFIHSAYAGPIYYTATLNGPSESPPNASPGAGFATVIVDSILHTLSVDVTFSGLIGTTTASHIHAATAVPGIGIAGVATVTPTFTAFPLGVTSGTYFHTFDTTLASSFNPIFITGHGGTVALAEAALFSAIADGKAYLNIHTTASTGGEIRGFLAVPEPTIISLMTLGVLGFLFAKRRTASLTSQVGQLTLPF
jgi:hypothetical protein